MAPKFIFTNNKGQSVEFSNSAPLFLKTYHGTGGSPADIQTQKSPGQDGETLIDTTLEMRDISLEVVILGDSTDEVMRYRRRLSQVFNPKLEPGVLKFECGDRENEIEAKPNGAPAFPGGEARGALYQECLIEMLATNPCWLDTYTEGREMAAWIGGLSFPLRLPTTFAKEGQEQVFNNDGDVATPIIAEFYGPATNPRLDNLTTGEFIRIKRDLLAGEKLIINTTFGNKSVMLVDADNVETNAMHWIDLDSTFWQLKQGENRIKYNADAGVDKARVKVSWRNRYVGV